MGDNLISSLGPPQSLPLIQGSDVQPVAKSGIGPDSKPTDAQAMKAAKAFESVLIERLMQEMKRTIPESGLLSSGATEQFQDLFWNQLADEVSRKGGLGLAQKLCVQLQKMGNQK